MAKKDVAVTVDRRGSESRGSDRRAKSDDRRKESAPVNVERRKLERREKVSRRRQIDPTTCERDYTPSEVEFMNAMNEYKRRSGRMFPTCSEILEVVQALGYVKSANAATTASTDAIVAEHAAAAIPVETL